MAVYFGQSPGQGRHALYESATGWLVEEVSQPQDERILPQWAKSRAQLDDESVPTSASLTQDRMMWIAKVLRQIGKVEPGMRRSNLYYSPRFVWDNASLRHKLSQVVRGGLSHRGPHQNCSAFTPAGRY